MKINCEIVQDLLPLYEDGICSKSSRAAVEAHLKECTACRGQRESAQMLPEGSITLEPEEVRAVDGLKKVRRRWGISLIAVLLLIPAIILSVNQALGRGIALENLDEIRTAKKFVAHLQKGEYKEAARMHDFTVMYKDIRDALSWTVEDYSRQFEKVEIGGKNWYLDTQMAENFQGGTTPYSFWHSIVYNHHYGVLIPEEALQMVAESEPGLLTRVTEGIYDCENGMTFRLFETPWGSFYTGEDTLQGVNLLDITLEDYGNRFTMMPEAMHEEVYPEMQRIAEGAYRWNQEAYGAVADMTEEEFTGFMRDKYAKQLKDYFDKGVTLTGGSYVNVLRTGDDAWQVEFSLRAAYGAQANDFSIIPIVSDGKITGVTGAYAYSIDYSWLRNLMEAITIRYTD